MLRFRRSDDLSRPARARGFGIHFDPDAFGQFSEAIARFLGTGRFLAGQTVVVAVWISVNVLAAHLRWDPYPFILLNLAFSTQAAYAAPLILLAQNRQAERDRAQAELDREVNTRTQAEAEFLARELASVRLTLADVATIEELNDAVTTIVNAVGDLADRVAALAAVMPSPSPGDDEGEGEGRPSLVVDRDVDHDPMRGTA